MLAITREKALGASSQKMSCLAGLAVYTVLAASRIQGDIEEAKVCFRREGCR